MGSNGGRGIFGWTGPSRPDNVQGWGLGVRGAVVGGRGLVVVGVGWGSTCKNRPSRHKYKSPKQFPLILSLETSELKSSKRT